MNDLVDQALTCIHELRKTNHFTSDKAVGEHLGINSAFLTHLNRGQLRPTLYRALIDQGLMPAPPPMFEMPVATAALMFSVAKFPRPRKKSTKQSPRAPRMSIQKENPELAAKAILKGMKADDVQMLIDLLIQGDSNA